MKLVGEPIQVELKKGWPMIIRRGNRQMVVTRLIDCWVAQGYWWVKEEKRIYFQLDTKKGSIEIYQSNSLWILARLFD